jgi:polar amino acid transport system permease protein
MVSAAVHLDWSLISERLFSPDHDFGRAMWTTIYISICAEIAGVLLGLGIALAARSHRMPLRALSGLYVWIVRGTPLIVQIFFIYFGANIFLGFDLFPRTVGLFGFGVSGAVVAGVVALAINEGAYMSEIIRAGLNSVDPGQRESALSVGMTPRMAMRRVILPQAARIIVPPLGNQFNSMMKSTSLLAFIGVYELFQDAQVHYSTDFKPVEYFASVALWYLVLTTVWQLIQSRIERRLAVSERDVVRKTWRERLFGVRPELQRGIG